MLKKIIIIPGRYSYTLSWKKKERKKSKVRRKKEKSKGVGDQESESLDLDLHVLLPRSRRDHPAPPELPLCPLTILPLRPRATAGPFEKPLTWLSIHSESYSGLLTRPASLK